MVASNHQAAIASSTLVPSQHSPRNRSSPHFYALEMEMPSGLLTHYFTRPRKGAFNVRLRRRAAAFETKQSAAPTVSCGRQQESRGAHSPHLPSRTINQCFDRSAQHPFRAQFSSSSLLFIVFWSCWPWPQTRTLRQACVCGTHADPGQAGIQQGLS